MNSFFYKGVPDYQIGKFRAVRNSADNLENLINIAEIVNTCQHLLLPKHDEDIDIAIFSGNYNRALVKKADGYFSMGIPFQIINHGLDISFNIDAISEPVSGRLISILRNATLTWRCSPTPEDVALSLCESFGLDAGDAIKYCNALLLLLSEDHGYFRFDDDALNQNGDIHPRYHYDFFFSNSTSIKVGSDALGDIDCFYALCDSATPKRYLR